MREYATAPTVTLDAATTPVPAAIEAPMRICVMTEAAHGLGGMQRHTHDLVRGLVRAGHDVHVICPGAAELSQHMHGARWHFLDIDITVMTRRDPLWREKYRHAFVAEHSKRPFDVVHSETTGAHGLLLKPAVQVPIVVKYHGAYLSLVKAHARRILQRPLTAPGELKGFAFMSRDHFGRGSAWAFRDCVSLAPSHEQMRDSARSQLVPMNLMHAVPNGIATDVFRPRDDREALRRSLDLPDGRIFVMAGRLNKEKGFDVALRALARIRTDFPAARLVVVGDGDQREPLGALASALGVSEETLFVGAQPPEGVAAYFGASDFFLFPTRRHEAGPIVLLEGMACGLPTIATRIGGNTEVVAPPEGPPAGLLVRLGSAFDLELAMRRLLTDESLAQTLGGRARERILEEYTVETMIERTVTAYRLAIERFRASGN